MLTIGLDVHQRLSTICLLDANGKVVKEKTIHGGWDRLMKELGQIDVPFQICYEASCGYGALHDRLSKLTQRVVVAHPGQLRLIFRSKRKNDRMDARKLATLLFLDQVPPVYVPSVDVRGWRGLIEHRGRLIDKRTRTKNALRSLLRSVGQENAPQGFRLWTRAGLSWLSEVSVPTEMDSFRRDTLLAELDHFQTQIRRVTRRLDEIGHKHPGLVILRTIPGVGARTAEAVVAFIDDPGRFPRVRSIGSYFGLVPCQDQSAGRNHLGRITRAGPATVRKLVVEAAWQAIRRSETVRARFERVMRGDPNRKKIALVATAHHLLRVMLAMLRTGEVCRWSPEMT